MTVPKLSHLVRLQQRAGTVDSVGQPSESWVDVGDVFADFRHMRGLESIKAGADTSVVRASARIRYRPGITSGMRLLWSNFIYDITSVLPSGDRKQFLDLTCTRISDVPFGD